MILPGILILFSVIWKLFIQMKRFLRKNLVKKLIHC
nr:unnamed protein product [Callosobruchus analis]